MSSVHPTESLAAPLAVPTQRRGLTAHGSWVRRQHPFLQVTFRIACNPMGAFGLGTLLLLLALAAFAPVVAPYSPTQQHPGLELRPPSSQFPLGSDDLGRDLFSRILFGARIS